MMEGKDDKGEESRNGGTCKAVEQHKHESEETSGASKAVNQQWRDAGEQQFEGKIKLKEFEEVPRWPFQVSKAENAMDRGYQLQGSDHEQSGR
eukprot:2816559-Karenia_brevis.AAC.1